MPPMTLTISQPQANEIEVVLFGPGYGECIVLHVEGDWIVIDSCREPVSGQPAALQYLSAIGVPFSQVRLVVCTHWHDDHTKGFGALYEACANAELVISSALRQSEFQTLIEAYRAWPKEPVPVSSGVDEIREALDSAQKRGKPPKFAAPDQRIWSSSSRNSELFSLSPSNKMVLLALSEIASSLPASGKPKKRVSVKNPNHVSVALHLKSGEHSVLLGSDLEEHSDPQGGWSAIVASTTRPTSAASLYKVAHHGSATGEHSGIWSNLLTKKPTSILTPFSRLRKPLPTKADRHRLRTMSSQAILTADAELKRHARKGPVARMLRGHSLRLIHSGFGAVRCRIDIRVSTARWGIEYQGDAFKL